MINSTTHNREEKKYKNWNKEIIELYLGKESIVVGTEEKMSANLCEVTNKDTPENQVEWVNENGKYTIAYLLAFKEDPPIEKNGLPLWKENNIQRKGVQRIWTITEECLKIHKLVFPGNQQFERGTQTIRT